MLDFQVSCLIDAFWRIGIYSDLQRDHLCLQVAKIENAVEKRRKDNPFSSKVELVVFIKQCCDYLMTLESFTFKQAYKDWRKTANGSVEQFYATYWKEDVCVRAGEDSAACTVEEIYEECAKLEYLNVPDHADALAIIRHTATDEQVKVFVSCMNGAGSIKPVTGALARLPQCKYGRKGAVDLVVSDVVKRAKVAAKEGRTFFLIEKEEYGEYEEYRDYDKLQKIVSQLGMWVHSSEDGNAVMFDECDESRYSDLDEESLKYLVDTAVKGKGLGKEFFCIAKRITEINMEALLNGFVDELLPLLERLNDGGDVCRVKKQAGYAAVYDRLFDRLKELGYVVEDKDTFYFVCDGTAKYG